MSTEIAQLYARIGADIGGLQSGLAGAKNDLTRAGGEMRAIGMGLSLGVTLPLVGIGSAALAASSDFQESMSRIQGLTNTTAEQFKGMNQAVLDLSKNTGKGPKELADALYFISSSGLQGQAALDVLTVSAKASVAGLGETKVIADALTTAVNAYGPANLSAAKAVDVLTQAVIEGKGEPDEFAGAFGRVLPIASAAGVSFDQVAASMATMTRTGLSTEEAATALRGILGALVAPGKEAEDTLKALGLSTNDLRAEIKDKGLLTALSDLNDRANKAASGINLATGPVQVNAKAVQDLKDKIADLASGLSIEEAKVKRESEQIALAGAQHYWAADVMQDHKTKLDGMNRTLEIHRRELGQANAALATATSGQQKNTLAGQDSIAILDKVIPNIRALTGVLSTTVAQGGSYKDTLNNINNSAGAMGKAYDVASQNANFALSRLKTNLEATGIAMASQFLPAITPIINMLADRLPSAISEAVKWFQALPSGAQQFLTILGLVAVAAGPVLMVLGLVATALGALISLPGLVVLALAALVAVWTMDIGGIQEITAQAFATIQSTIQSALELIQGWWAAHGTEVTTTVSALWQSAQNYFNMGLAFISSIVQSALAGIQVWWSAHGTNVITVVNGFWGLLQGIVSAGLGLITGIVNADLMMLSGLWQEITTLLQGNWSFLWTMLGSIVTNAVAIINAVVDGWAALFQGNWTAVGENLRIIWDSAWQIIGDILGAALGTLLLIGMNLVKQFSDIFSKTDWAGIGHSIMDGIAKGVVDSVKNAIKAIQDAAHALIDAARAAVGAHSPSVVFDELGRDLMSGLAQGVTAQTGVAVSAMQRAMKELNDSANKEGQKWIDAFNDVTNTSHDPWAANSDDPHYHPPVYGSDPDTYKGGDDKGFGRSGAIAGGVAGAGASGVQVTINIASMASDMDVEDLAYKVARVFQRKGN